MVHSDLCVRLKLRSMSVGDDGSMIAYVDKIYVGTLVILLIVGNTYSCFLFLLRFRFLLNQPIHDIDLRIYFDFDVLPFGSNVKDSDR